MGLDLWVLPTQAWCPPWLSDIDKGMERGVTTILGGGLHSWPSASAPREHDPSCSSVRAALRQGTPGPSPAATHQRGDPGHPSFSFPPLELIIAALWDGVMNQRPGCVWALQTSVCKVCPESFSVVNAQAQKGQSGHNQGEPVFPENPHPDPNITRTRAE